MESVLTIILALLTVGAADFELTSGSPRPILVGLMVFVPYVWAFVVRRAQYRGRFRLSAFLERTLVLLPLALQGLSVTYFDWLKSVGVWTGTQPSLSAWPGLELLLGIAPYCAIQIATLHARTLLRDPRRSDRRALFFFQARMFLSGLAPFALYVGLSALLGQSDEVRVRLEEISLYNTFFTVVLLGGFLAVLPFLLKNTWSTTPLPEGDLRTLLEEVAEKSDFEFRELLLWNTGQQMANAAIIGFTRRTRVVLFTDALLRQLHPRELAAVFAHEMGHARRHHALTFVFFVVIVFVGAQVLLDAAGIQNEWFALAILGALLALWMLSFGYLSRRFELEADLNSLDALGDPMPLASALVRVTGAPARDRDGWRHFSTAKRVRFLVAAAKDPSLALRLRRTLKRWSRGAALVALVLVVVWGLRLWDLRPAEELTVDLRLGDWESAHVRVDDGLVVDEDLGKLIERAYALEPQLSAEQLESAAREAASTGDPVAARELLELARLRGTWQTGKRLNALQELLSELEDSKPSTEGFARRMNSLDPAWRTALEQMRVLRQAALRPGSIPRR